MSERLLLPCFVFVFCLSCLYFFSLSLSLFYLFSVLNFNFHEVLLEAEIVLAKIAHTVQQYDQFPLVENH